MLSERERAEILEWMLEAKDADDNCLARGHQGSLHLYEGEAGTYVVKSPSGRGIGGWARRWMVRNEFRSYEQLRGIEGFPACHGLIDGRYLVLSYIDADSLATHKLANPETFFERVKQLVERMHAAGVAHGDLRRRSNVLVGHDEQPIIVDLGTSVRVNERSGWLKRRLFALLKQDDLHSWVKLKYRRTRLAAPHDRQLESPFLVKRVRKAIRRVRRAKAFRPSRS